jgi:hypothetical protein
MNLLNTKIGKLDQGTIFTCARAERYHGVPVYGLVITARCDIDQQKYPVLNYIPVVSLVDWLGTDGFDLIQDKAERDSYGRIKNIFKSYDFAESLLIAKSARDIFETS